MASTTMLPRDDAAGTWRGTSIPIPAIEPGFERRLLVTEEESTPADVPTVNNFERRVVYADALTI